MSFYYLATPYSKYPEGTAMAHVHACQQAAFLMRHGVTVFCPIAHTHPVAEFGALDRFDHDFWMPHDERLMRQAVGMIQCRLSGWERSHGMQLEAQLFQADDKPVVPMVPGVLPGRFREG